MLGGAALLVAGLGWMLWAAWMFRQAGNAIGPSAAPSMLVDEGPYRYGRNPMYLGMTVALLGVGLALGAPFMVLAAVDVRGHRAPRAHPVRRSATAARVRRLVQ